VRCQAVHSCTNFVVTDMRILSTVPVIASGPLRGPGAARGSVEVVAHCVPLEPGATSSLQGAGTCCGVVVVTAASAVGPASASVVVAVLALAVSPVVEIPAARPLEKSGPLLYCVGPPFFPLSVGDWCLSGHGPAGILSQDLVDEVRD
jgi:hypothetical protein